MISYPHGATEAMVTLIAVGALFVVVFCAILVDVVKRQWAMRNWKRVEGKILRVRSHGRSWSQSLWYSYTFEGKIFEGRDSIGFELFRFNKAYKVGDGVELMVSPTNPSKSYMHLPRLGFLDNYTIRAIAFIASFILMAAFLYYFFWLPYGQFLK